MGIIANIILIIYNYGEFLNGWNSNTIGLLTTIGALGLIISYKLQDTKRKKIINMIFVLFSLFMIVLTDNRNSLLVFVIAFISIIIINSKIWKKKMINIFLLIALLLPIIVATTYDQINNIPALKQLNDLSKEIFQKDTLFSGREEIWNEGQRLIKGNFLFGTGESLYNHIYVHNMYYSVIYFFGITGYILYAVFLYRIIKNAVKSKSNLSTYCVLAFIAIIFEQIAENTLFTADLNVFMPYILLSISINEGMEKKYEKNDSIYTNL